MGSQAGFFDVDDRLKRLSDLGDEFEAVQTAVNFRLYAAIDRRFGFIPKWRATDAAACRYRLFGRPQTGSSSSRTALSVMSIPKTEGTRNVRASCRANNAKSKIGSCVEHVFAEQKERMDLFIRTTGIAGATPKSDLTNLVQSGVPAAVVAII